MLKSKYATKAEIPEGQAAFYLEKDGAFVLDADLSDHPTVVGLRENRDTILGEKKKLAEEHKAVVAALDGVKSTAGITDISELANVLKGKKTEKDADIEKLLSERTAAMKGELEKTIKELTERDSKNQAQLQVLLIDNAITAEATKAGVQPTAIPDVLLRGRSLYKLVDGKPTPMEGDKVIYGKDGLSPMPPSEWLGRLTSEAPHLFTPSQGGGARPGEGSGRAGATSFTLTRAEAKDPARYQQARAAAEKAGTTVTIAE